MATYYVDPVNGNDANNGLGPDASHASNKPFSTISKLLEASGALATGDTAYLAPGVYNETITVAITSYTTETFIIGDPLNTQGFKTAAGVLVAPGVVLWTNHTSGLTSASENADCLSLAGRDFVTFRNISFYAGHSNAKSCVLCGSSTSTDIKFEDCEFTTRSSLAAIYVSSAAAVAQNLTVRRCSFFCQGYALRITMTAPASADLDSAILIENCCMICGPTALAAIYVSQSSGSYISGGVVVKGCSIFASVVCVQSVFPAALTTCTYPVLVSYCTLNGQTGLSAAHSSHLTSLYNLFCSATARSSVSAGTGDQTNYAALHLFPVRSFFSPHPSSPALSMDASGTGLSTDFLNRPRPSGTSSANKTVGALERHDYGTQDSTVYDAGSSSIRLLGPGDHELRIPVDAAATTISIKVQYDNAGANDYTGTDYPQAILLDTENFANISGGTETETATASAAGAWETLTFTAFTPSRKGVVRLRLVSRDTAGDGYCYFDTLTVT